MEKKTTGKLIIVAAILGIIVAFNFLDLGSFLTLDYIKSSQEQFSILYSQNKVAVISAYMAVYIMVTAFSLPGAAVLTLAGGGLFGFIAGTLIVSFSSSIGATLACFISRFLLRNWVQNRFGDKLAVIHKGIEQEGAFYLFSLRLIPLFPFFVINLVFGLTKLPLFTFYWVSQAGMFLGTMVFVNAGKELAQIDSLSGILSPGLLISFILLGIFPITVKKLVGIYRTHQTS